MGSPLEMVAQTDIAVCSRSIISLRLFSLAAKAFAAHASEIGRERERGDNNINDNTGCVNYNSAQLVAVVEFLSNASI